MSEPDKEVEEVKDLAGQILEAVGKAEGHLAALPEKEKEKEAPTVVLVVPPGTKVVTVAPPEAPVEEETCQ